MSKSLHENDESNESTNDQYVTLVPMIAQDEHVDKPINDPMIDVSG